MYRFDKTLNVAALIVTTSGKDDCGEHDAGKTHDGNEDGDVDEVNEEGDEEEDKEEDEETGNKEDEEEGDEEVNE